MPNVNGRRYSYDAKGKAAAAKAAKKKPKMPKMPKKGKKRGKC